MKEKNHTLGVTRLDIFQHMQHHPHRQTYCSISDLYVNAEIAEDRHGKALDGPTMRKAIVTNAVCEGHPTIHSMKKGCVKRCFHGNSITIQFGDAIHSLFLSKTDTISFIFGCGYSC